MHKNDKGIIHTTSYEQIRFIQKYISTDNRMRLIFTDPEKPKEQVTAEHFISSRPTVFILPSLHNLNLEIKQEEVISKNDVLILLPKYGKQFIKTK